MTLRRDFLGFTSGAVAACTVPAMAAEAETADRQPDAALLATVASFHEVEADRIRLDAAYDATDEEVTSAVERWFVLMRAVTDMRPVTQAGVRAKASVGVVAFRYRLEQMRGHTVEGQAEWHEMAAWRLMNDILCLATSAVNGDQWPCEQLL